MDFDRSLLNEIDANLHALEIDEIKSRLEKLTIGLRVECPIFDPGAFLYRARKLGASFNKGLGIKLENLIYPPKEFAQLGRLNRHQSPMFYCGMQKEPIFFELQDLQPGDEIVVTFWKTNARMLVNNIGYTDYIFQRLGAKRSVPRWNSPDAGSEKANISLLPFSPEMIDVALEAEVNRGLIEAFSHYFMQSVGQANVDAYKMTVAIGELHLGKVENHEIQFAGVLYPSVRMWANGDNLALFPWFVDKHVEFRKAVHIRIDARDDTTISITSLDSAKEFDTDGSLKWLGRMPQWTLGPGKAGTVTLSAGLDDDGDYVTDKNGAPCHWRLVDASTGDLIPAV